jgi:pSer/pThr/pTyr-binding forkhead associated (FHA) protein
MVELIFVKGPKAGECITLTKDRISIGRLGCDLELNHPKVSRQHAFIRCVDGRVTIKDNRSSNGTYVNGRRTTSAVLRDGDEVRIGEHVFRLQVRATAAKPGEQPTRRQLISRFLIEDRTSGVRRLEFAGDHLTIGRSEKCKLVLDDDELSRRHAVIKYRNGSFEIEDLGSANGTYLNCEAVQTAGLKRGDRIEMGGLEIAVQSATGALHLVITRRRATGQEVRQSQCEADFFLTGAAEETLAVRSAWLRYPIIGGLGLALAVALLLFFVGRTHASPARQCIDAVPGAGYSNCDSSWHPFSGEESRNINRPLNRLEKGLKLCA